MDLPAESVYLHNSAGGLKEKLVCGRTTVLGRAHVPAGPEALQVSRSVQTPGADGPRRCSHVGRCITVAACRDGRRAQASVELLPSGRLRVSSLAAVNPTLVLRAVGGEALTEVLLHQGQHVCNSMTGQQPGKPVCTIALTMERFAGESVDVGVGDRIALAAANRNCFLEVCSEKAASAADVSKRCCRS